MAKRWKLGEMEFQVDELTIAQDQEIMRLFVECNLTDFSTLTAAKIMSALGAQRKLQEFFALVLIPVNGAFDLGRLNEISLLAANMKNSAALEVAEDFFAKNSAFWKKLDGYFSKLTLLIKSRLAEIEQTLKKAESMNTPISSSVSPAAVSN